MSTRELRAELADVINAAGVHNQVTFVTSRGRRVAAVVSVTVAGGRRARRPGGQRCHHGAELRRQRRDARGPWRHPRPDPGPDLWSTYASDLLRELGHDPDRIMAAARAVTARMADKVGYPALVPRHDALAIELCEMAVELTGQARRGGVPARKSRKQSPGSRRTPLVEQVKAWPQWPTGCFPAADDGWRRVYKACAADRPRSSSRRSRTVGGSMRSE